jgi:hypothetical protein
LPFNSREAAVARRAAVVSLPAPANAGIGRCAGLCDSPDWLAAIAIRYGAERGTGHLRRPTAPEEVLSSLRAPSEEISKREIASNNDLAGQAGLSTMNGSTILNIGLNRALGDGPVVAAPCGERIGWACGRPSFDRNQRCPYFVMWMRQRARWAESIAHLMACLDGGSRIGESGFEYPWLP